MENFIPAVADQSWKIVGTGDFNRDGKIDILRIRPIARLGYYDYTSIESIFEMKPASPERGRGLEGRPDRSP